MTNHRTSIDNPEIETAADFVYRTLFALAVQTVMFSDREVTPHAHTNEVWARETSRLLLGYLRTA